MAVMLQRRVRRSLFRRALILAAFIELPAALLLIRFPISDVRYMTTVPLLLRYVVSADHLLHLGPFLAVSSLVPIGVVAPSQSSWVTILTNVTSLGLVVGLTYAFETLFIFVILRLRHLKLRSE